MGTMHDFTMRRVGNDLSLDFINTANFHGTENHEEYLGDFHVFWSWARQVGVLDKVSYSSTSIEIQQKDAGDAELVYEEAIRLREAMYRIALSAIQGQTTLETDLDLFNAWLRQANEHYEMVQLSNGEFTQEYVREDRHRSLLFPIVHAFQRLLIGKTFERVKQCNSEQCQWLFIDTTKNNSRQWCTMDVCGNREKAKKYYQSHKRNAD